MPTPPPPPVKEFSAPPTVPIPVVSEQPVPVVSEQPSQVVVSMDAVEVEVPQGSDRTNVSVILRSKRDGSILRLVGRRRQWTDIAKRLGILSDRGEK
jgi:hypothetical protein